MTRLSKEIMETLSPHQSGHQHVMTLREISKYCETIKCQLCGEKITGSPAYCCVDCSYFIHKECGELPIGIHHPFHPEHSLVRSERETHCNFCGAGRWSKALHYYSCDKCDYSLDVICAISTLHQEEVEEERSREILHFLHKHPLKYYHVTGKNNHISCKMCRNGKENSEQDSNLYACLDCKFLLHERCSKFSEEIKAPSFHEHSLTYSSEGFFRKGESGYYECGICLRNLYGSNRYECSVCSILLHTDCVVLTLPPTPREDDYENTMEGVKYPFHDHPLSSFYADLQSRIRCQICGYTIKGAFYGCTICRFFIHKSCSCTELPQVVKHPLYPQRFLTLTTASSSYNCCYKCRCLISTLSYTTSDCVEPEKLWMHVHCADAFNEDGQSMEKQCPGHEHPLTLLKQCTDPVASCWICVRNFEDGPLYYCRMEECGRWLHKECAEVHLVTEKHPLHPDHSLSVVPFTSIYEDLCSVCYYVAKEFVVSCMDCEFKLNVYCACRRQTLKHPRHEHTLAYFEESVSKREINNGHKIKKKERINNCAVCGKRCEFDLYHCVICKFDMHYFCLPLPPTVSNSEVHVDELSLLDVPLDKDGSGEYCYCCGEPMHPQQGSYSCKDCELNCHIDCTIPCKIEDKALHELKEEIAVLKEKVETKKENLVAAKENLVAAMRTLEAAKNKLKEVEKEMKELEIGYGASTQQLSTWTRNRN